MAAENNFNIKPLTNVSYVSPASPSGEQSNRKNRRFKNKPTDPEIDDSEAGDDGEDMHHVIDYRAWLNEREYLMSQNLGQIIRKNQVKNAGSCRLGDITINARQPLSAIPKQKPSGEPCAAQIRIIENTQTGIVLEHTCSCGLKTYIQCDYKTEK